MICRVSFIDFYLVFPRNVRIVFLTHTNTVILLEPCFGTIKEPGLPVLGTHALVGTLSGVSTFDFPTILPSRIHRRYKTSRAGTAEG